MHISSVARDDNDCSSDGLDEHRILERLCTVGVDGPEGPGTKRVGALSHHDAIARCGPDDSVSIDLLQRFNKTHSREGRVRALTHRFDNRFNEIAPGKRVGRIVRHDNLCRRGDRREPAAHGRGSRGTAGHRGRHRRTVPLDARRKDDNDLIAHSGRGLDDPVDQPAAADQGKLLAPAKAGPASRRKDYGRNTASRVHDR